MAQFDVYKNPNKKSNKEIPFLLDIQSDILKDLKTKVVVPLILNTKAITHLNPIFTIEDEQVMMSTAELASISMDNIGEKVCNIEDKRTNIINAIDFMITGF